MHRKGARSRGEREGPEGHPAAGRKKAQDSPRRAHGRGSFRGPECKGQGRDIQADTCLLWGQGPSSAAAGLLKPCCSALIACLSRGALNAPFSLTIRRRIANLI